MGAQWAGESSVRKATRGKQETDIKHLLIPSLCPCLWLCQTLHQARVFSTVGKGEENTQPQMSDSMALCDLEHVTTAPGKMRQGTSLFYSQVRQGEPGRPWAVSPSVGWSFSSLPSGKWVGKGHRKEGRPSMLLGEGESTVLEVEGPGGTEVLWLCAGTQAGC